MVCQHDSNLLPRSRRLLNRAMASAPEPIPITSYSVPYLRSRRATNLWRSSSSPATTTIAAVDGAPAIGSIIAGVVLQARSLAAVRSDDSAHPPIRRHVDNAHVRFAGLGVARLGEPHGDLRPR